MVNKSPRQLAAFTSQTRCEVLLTLIANLCFGRNFCAKGILDSF